MMGRWMAMLVGLLLFLGVLLGSCTRRAEEQIVRLHLVDQNGMSETIQSKERLSRYQKVDFLSPQPFRKVHRVYGRGKDGSTYATLTSYYPNGQLCQYLEIVDARAYGAYREWHPNGQLRLQTEVVGGPADIEAGAI